MKEINYNFSTIFNFGKHKGKTLKTVLETNADYVAWCLKNVDGFSLDFESMKYLILKASLGATNNELTAVFDGLEKSFLNEQRSVRKELININKENLKNTPQATEEAEKLIELLYVEGNR